MSKLPVLTMSKLPVRCFSLALLSLWLLPQAQAAPTAAKVIIGGRNVPFVVAPFVGGDGQVYAPAEAVRLLGADFAPNDNGTLVKITSPGSKPVTVPCLRANGRYCIALQKAALALGANADWQPTTQTLTLRAKMQMVRQNSTSLAIYTSYPVTYTVQHLSRPSRVYVDLYGLDLASTPASIPVVEDEDHPNSILRIRSGQVNFNTVRITLDLKRDMAFKVISGAQTNHVRVAFAADAQSLPAEVASLPAVLPGSSPIVSSVPREALPSLPVSAPAAAGRQHPLPTTPPVRTVVNPPVPILPQVPAAQRVRITSVGLKAVSDSVTQIVVSTTGPVKYRTETLNNPNRLAFDFAGASLDSGVNVNLPGIGPIIKAVRSGILHAPQTQFGRIVVDLSRIVGYSVSSVPGANGMTYLLSLQMPRTTSASARPSSANSLSGKTIVVDPGHGAEDTGALGIDGSHEKDLTLAIGRKLRDTLVQNGATVFMTRQDDSKPSVNARPLMAIAHHADYFVSIHCDSNSGWHTSRSGTTVYFHAQNAQCRRMAQDVVNRVSEVSGLPAIGVQTDYIRFPGIGFGVLRGSPMPAVLVECGYMNNDRDLAMLKEDTVQQNIALGIVAGLRDFIADRAAR